MKALSVALISRDNGVGLTADMQLLDAMLTKAGHTVSRVEWTDHAMPHVDVGMFLELWNPRLARYARKTVGIFNLEWFQSAWSRDLPRLNQLWAKSIESHAVYSQRMRLRSSTLTGFLSRDLNDPSVLRQKTALHLRGHSDFKNTHAVIDAWRVNPGLPPLTIISSVPLEVPSHVRVLGRVSDEQLRHEMNSATFHICPSRAEGWGHYITEALSVGGVVITTNASPMNEHVHPDWGVLVNPTRATRHGMVTVYGVSARVLGDAVEHAQAIPDDRLDFMRSKARAHFDFRNARFRETALELLERI